MRRPGRGIAFLVPGTFARLAYHHGFFQAWYDHGFPRPDIVVAASAGALVWAAIVTWSAEAFARLRDVVRNLTRNKIAVFRPELKRSLLQSFLIAASFVIGVIFLVRYLNPLPTVFVGACVLLVLIGSGVFFGRSFWKSPSVFTTEPLRKLLEKTLDFDAIFRSPIELRILATDLEKPGAILFSNHETSDEPLHTDPNNPAHCQRFLKILLGSTSIPGIFPWVEVDNRALGDAEIWTDRAIHYVEQYRHVLIFDYWVGKGLRTETRPKTWLGYFFRAFDIARDRNSLNKERDYYERCQRNPELPELFHVRASHQLLGQMPELSLDSFNKQQLQTAMELGYRIFEENMPAIRRYLNIQDSKKNTP